LVKPFPQPEAPGQGLHGHQSRLNRVVGVGDKLQLEPGCFRGDRRHVNQTLRPQNNPPQFASAKHIVTFLVKSRSNQIMAITGLQRACQNSLEMSLC
jgi:hypothetical protein